MEYSPSADDNHFVVPLSKESGSARGLIPVSYAWICVTQTHKNASIPSQHSRATGNIDTVTVGILGVCADERAKCVRSRMRRARFRAKKIAKICAGAFGYELDA